MYCVLVLPGSFATRPSLVMKGRAGRAAHGSSLLERTGISSVCSPIGKLTDAKPIRLPFRIVFQARRVMRGRRARSLRACQATEGGRSELIPHDGSSGLGCGSRACAAPAVSAKPSALLLPMMYLLSAVRLPPGWRSRFGGIDHPAAAARAISEGRRRPRRGGPPDGLLASRSVVFHQSRKGSRITIVGPEPDLVKHLGGISPRDLLFCIVPQRIAPPVRSSSEGPAKTRGNASRSSSTTGCMS
jgi:hypothetical protein